MNTEILKVLKDLRSDLFYQIESKFGAEKASKYPSMVDADSLINKLTISGVSQQRELLIAYEKNHYTPQEWALASKQCIEDIDNFLAINCG